jgi:hypothetical protein
LVTLIGNDLLLQERNKPIQPPKKPEAAPFFLPTVPGLEGNPIFDTEALANGEETIGDSAILNPDTDLESRLDMPCSSGSPYYDVIFTATGMHEACMSSALLSPCLPFHGARNIYGCTVHLLNLFPCKEDLHGILLCPGSSRVVKGPVSGDVSGLTRLLLEGRRAKDYSRLLSYLRILPPSRLDAELRAMQARSLPVSSWSGTHSAAYSCSTCASCRCPGLDAKLRAMQARFAVHIQE